MKKHFNQSPLCAVFAGLLSVMVLAACSDKDVSPLQFNKEIYGVTLGNSVEVPIVSGNGNYTIFSEDESIADAGFTKTGKNSPGRIVVSGKKEGQTWVNVTDLASNDNIKLKVVVTEQYFSILGYLSEITVKGSVDNPPYREELEEKLRSEYPFGKDDFIFHLMKGSDEVRIEQYPSEKPTAVYIGKYAISQEKDDCILSVTFEDKSGKVHDKRYVVKGTGLTVFEAFFKGNIPPSARNSITNYVLYLEENLTEKYREEYPDLDFAGMECFGEASANSWMDVRNYP